jgi:hypothetical protein
MEGQGSTIKNTVGEGNLEDNNLVEGSKLAKGNNWRWQQARRKNLKGKQ